MSRLKYYRGVLLLVLLAVASPSLASPPSQQSDHVALLASEEASFENNDIVDDSKLPGEHGEEESESDDKSAAVQFDFQCMVCHWGAQVLVDYQRKGKTIDEFLSVVSTLCHLVGIETKVTKSLLGDSRCSTNRGLESIRMRKRQIRRCHNK